MPHLNAADWISVLAQRTLKKGVAPCSGQKSLLSSYNLHIPTSTLLLQGGGECGVCGGVFALNAAMQLGIITIHYSCCAMVLFIEQKKSRLTYWTCMSISAGMWVSFLIDISGQVWRTTLFPTCQWKRVIRWPCSGSTSLLCLWRCTRNCLCITYALTK